MGDDCALEAFEICGKMLGKGLSIICDMLNPDAVVIGSIYERCRDLLEKNTLKWLRQEALPAVSGHVKVLPAALGDKIGDLAAIAVAMDA
jgi:glucokinase